MQLVSQLSYEATSSHCYHSKAIDFLQSLPSESIDLIVTSPPYFVGKEYDISRSIKDFKTEFNSTVKEIIRCLKPTGNVCWQVGNHIQEGRLTPLDSIIVSELLENRDLKLRNRIIWTFGHGAHASKRFSGRHETILWYSKGNQSYFDLDPLRVPQLYPGKRHYKGPKKGEWSGNPLGKNPGDVWDLGCIWEIPNVKAKHIEKTEHPCQFPTALVRRLVIALSPKGGTVVDPYLGSGTTAISALIEHRNFIGCDLEKRYLAIADERLRSMTEGNLLIREDKPIRKPDPNESVAKTPPHFSYHKELI